MIRRNYDIDRYRRAWELRRSGAPWSRVADQLGMSVVRTQRVLQQWEAQQQKKRDEHSR